MTDSGKDLQVGGLVKISEGITKALAELEEIGMVGMAGAGRGFEGMTLSGIKTGHAELTSAFDSFCERWEWGVRSLISEGNNFAEGVGLAAGTLHQTDEYVDGALKIGANAVMGNPYATEDDITKMSWGELGRHHALADPDYSEKSFDDARANIKQGYKDAGRDVATSVVGAPVTPRQISGMNDKEYNAWVERTFGPSAEERAEAAAQQGAGAH
ncbi:hypothetical protein ACFVTY_29235 [Streptomyces sp. NPDC058067]|uniref:hypothetical protein n=1 Tax=Streptomyces sp. NPDC058067 TaxID=3346324 RepID=UPI0036E63102